MKIAEFEFELKYKPRASHHLPVFLSRADINSGSEHIKDDIPCLAVAETPHGAVTQRYAVSADPTTLDYAEVNGQRRTDAFCKSVMIPWAPRSRSTSVRIGPCAARPPTEASRSSPSGSKLICLHSQHYSTLAAHPGMKKMYYTVRTQFYWPSMISIFTVQVPTAHLVDSTG